MEQTLLVKRLREDAEHYDHASMSDAAYEIKRLQDLLFAAGAMNEAPCFCCGYNGPGYFQSTTHGCAARHHSRPPSISATIDLLGRGRFVSGQRARKIGGSYQASGTIRASFLAKDGTPRHVFEFDNPSGLLHIFGDPQLEA